MGARFAHWTAHWAVHWLSHWPGSHIGIWLTSAIREELPAVREEGRASVFFHQGGASAREISPWYFLVILNLGGAAVRAKAQALFFFVLPGKSDCWGGQQCPLFSGSFVLSGRSAQWGESSLYFFYSNQGERAFAFPTQQCLRLVMKDQMSFLMMRIAPPIQSLLVLVRAPM